MGMQLGSSSARRGRRAFNAEINVTPFVDVMLVLLIIFMITATALQRGVEVNLPQAATSNLTVPKTTPLLVTVTQDAKVYISETEIELEELSSKLLAIAGEGYEERIFLQGDTNAAYGEVLSVMTQMKNAGFTNIALVTDPKSRVERTE
ncbi:MAG: biopolymer transporter ExbD [Pseudomonadota bacterium]